MLVIKNTVITTLILIVINGANAGELKEFKEFVKEGKMDVLLALIMAGIWAIKMVSYVRANKRSEAPRTTQWILIERLSEYAVLAVGVIAVALALTINGLNPMSITNVIAVSVAIFISYTILPKVFRDNKDIRNMIIAICAHPRYKIAETRYVENVCEEKFNKIEKTLAIEYVKNTSGIVDVKAFGPWIYRYSWNGKVHEREADVTLLVTDGRFDDMLFNMSGNKAQKILNDCEVSDQRLVLANLLAGMVPKSWFCSSFWKCVLELCWEDTNTRYAVVSATGIGYGIKGNNLVLDCRQEWVEVMKEYVIEVMAIYLGEGNDYQKKLTKMLKLMKLLQNNIYRSCHNGFNSSSEDAIIHYCMTC